MNTKYNKLLIGFLLCVSFFATLDLNHSVSAASSEKRVPFIGTSFDYFPALVKVFKDSAYMYIESHGFPAQKMMVGITNWQQQVPVPQEYTGDNAWQIPLQAKVSNNPVSLKNNLFRGAVAVAVDGVPVFNALNNRGENSHDVGELDSFGGHSGKGGDYHYHTSPLLLESITGKGKPVAYGLDGYAMYASTEPDGSAMKNTLDACHGHTWTDGVYHYHATTTYPYSIGCMKGEVTVIDDQISPQPRAYTNQEVGNPLPGATITDFIVNGPFSYSLEYIVNTVKYYIHYKKNASGDYDFTRSNSPMVTSVASVNSVNSKNKKLKILKNSNIKNGSGSSKSNGNSTKNQVLSLTSSSLIKGNILPAEYTCDGVSATPALEWMQAPKGTKSFVVIMHHIPKDGDAHYYWQLYNIPAHVQGLAKNTNGIGEISGNSVNDKREYAPPCSKGPGEKVYTITLYALSEMIALDINNLSINRDEMLEKIKNITIGKAELHMKYSR